MTSELAEPQAKRKMRTKVKTSVSISPKALEMLKEIARRDDRSVSYVLEKFIEHTARQLQLGKRPRKKRGLFEP